MPTYWLLFVVGVLTSVAAISIGILFSRYLAIADHPGGEHHKQHQVSTPFVGGLGVVGGFLVAIALARDRQWLTDTETWAITTGVSIIFILGFTDDLWRLGYKIRFLFQGLAACLMAYGGGMIVTDLGQLAPGVAVELGPLALFFTVFATLGAINAVNMIDGIDGLTGSVSLVSLLLLGGVALAAGPRHCECLILIVALSAGVVGFLGFNLRCFGRRRALVFLGDNGSMVLGFLFAWFFIALSQGPDPAMTPVTALWLFAVPLIDTVTVMIRRIWLGRSPFHPDRFHLHHLLLRAGFRVGDVVLALAVLQGLLGIIGLTGLYLGVWESLMFAGFLGLFVGYLYLVSRPWRCVPALRCLHARLGLLRTDCQGVFVGYFDLEAAGDMVRVLREELGAESDCDLRVYQLPAAAADTGLYAVLENEFAAVDPRAELEIGRLVARLRKRFGRERNIAVRQYVRRDPANDRRGGQKEIPADLRRTDRRDTQEKTLWYADYALNRALSCAVRFAEGEALPQVEEAARQGEGP